MQIDPETELDEFLSLWLENRPFSPAVESSTNFEGNISGSVVFRDGQFQVQVFIVKPNSIIEPHIHPDVDSFEVFVCGDIVFSCNGEFFSQSKYGDSIRVKQDSWHGGVFGESGGCFLSVQKWMNGVKPTSVGDNWIDVNGGKHGNASSFA